MQDDIDLEAREARRAKKQREEKAEQRKEGADFVDLMSTQSGRRMAHQLLARAGVFHTSFAPGDPHVTSFNEGKRSIGLYLLAMITEHTPTQYPLMLKENASG